MCDIANIAIAITRAITLCTRAKTLERRKCLPAMGAPEVPRNRQLSVISDGCVYIIKPYPSSINEHNEHK